MYERDPLVLLQFLAVAGMMPLAYSLCGLWIRWLRPGQDEPQALDADASPLIAGAWSLGFVGLICWYLSLPYLWVSPFLLGPGIWILGRSSQVRREFAAGLWEIYGYYVLLLVVVSVYPFPGLFQWFGDWFDSLSQATLLVKNDPLGNKVSYLIGARSPISGFGAGWAYLLERKGFLTFQAHFALVSAGFLLVLFRELRKFTGTALNLGWKLSMALSAPVLLHSLTMWSKPLSAACVVLALGEAWRARQVFQRGASKRRPMVRFAFWMAAALSAHTAAIIFMPFFVLLAIWPLFRAPRQLLTQMAIIAVICFFIGGSAELASMARLGLKEKVALNPAVLYRKNISVGKQTLINLEYTLMGNPPEVLDALARAEAVLGHDAWPGMQLWVCRGVLPTMFAGSLLMSFVPFLGGAWPAGFWKRAGGWLRIRANGTRAKVVVGAIMLILIIHAYLTPYGNGLGIVQAGLLPLQMVGLAFTAYVFQVWARPVSRGIAQFSLIALGAGQIVLISSVVSFCLLPGVPKMLGFLDYMKTLPNMNFIMENKVCTLACSFFPLLPPCLAMVAGLLFAIPAWRRRKTNLQEIDTSSGLEQKAISDN